MKALTPSCRLPLTCALAIIVAAAIPGAPQAVSAQASRQSAAPAAACSTEAAAKVRNYVAKMDSLAGLGTSSKWSARCVDLNGKAPPEALLILAGTDNCGARGCAAFALDLSGLQARSIGDFIATNLDPLPTRTHGWRDLSLNGVRVTFQNGAYKPR